MISWLRSLFGEKKETKRRRKVLSTEEKRNMVTDYMINKLSYQKIADKYGCSKGTAWNVINKQWKLSGAK